MSRRIHATAAAAALVLATITGFVAPPPASADTAACPTMPTVTPTLMANPVWTTHSEADVLDDWNTFEAGNAYSEGLGDLIDLTSAPVGAEVEVVRGTVPPVGVDTSDRPAGVPLAPADFGDPNATVTTTWTVDGTSESGGSDAEGPTYYPQADDLGHSVSVTYTATDPTSGCAPVSVSSNALPVTTGTLIGPTTATLTGTTSRYGTPWAPVGSTPTFPEPDGYQLPDRSGTLQQIPDEQLDRSFHWSYRTPGVTYLRDRSDPASPARPITTSGYRIAKTDASHFALSGVETISFSGAAATATVDSDEVRPRAPIRARITARLTPPHDMAAAFAQHWLRGVRLTVTVHGGLQEYEWEHPTLDSRAFAHTKVDLVRTGAKSVGTLTMRGASWHTIRGNSVAALTMSARNARFAPAGRYRVWAKPVSGYTMTWETVFHRIRHFSQPVTLLGPSNRIRVRVP